MTRNTRLFKAKVTIKGEIKDIIYRDLSVLEFKFLENIKNQDMKEEMAGRIAILNMNPHDLEWPILVQIGQQSLEKTIEIMIHPDVNTIIFDEIKENAKKDRVLYLISRIKLVFPYETITDLLNLTYKDLLEIVAMAELLTGQNVLETEEVPVANPKKRKLINPNDLPDGGKSIQEKLERLNRTFGYN